MSVGQFHQKAALPKCRAALPKSFPLLPLDHSGGLHIIGIVQLLTHRNFSTPETVLGK